MRLTDDLFIIREHTDNQYSIELQPECRIYKAHFPGMPITPGVCIIQIAVELLADLLGYDVALTEVVNAKFLKVINPLEDSSVDYIFRKVSTNPDDNSIKALVQVTKGDAVYTKLTIICKPVG